MLPEYRTPPLLAEMAAFLFWWTHPHIPLESLHGWNTSFWVFVQSFKSHLVDVRQAHLIARLPLIFLTTTIGAIVYRWGKRMWGRWAGLLALGVCVFDPNLLAHGRLATTDAGVTAIGVATFYVIYLWMSNPSWLLTLSAGMLLGGVLLSKQSGIVWVAATGLVALWVTVFRLRERARDLRFLVKGACIGAISVLVLWIGYGLTWGRVKGLPVPLPAPLYWEGVLYQPISAAQRWIYALGVRRYGRLWWYFPVAFLLKNPLPLIVLLLIALRSLWRQSRSTLGFLILFPSLYTAIAMFWGMNIGYRHMLPIHPFLHLVIGGGIFHWMNRRARLPWRRFFVAALIGWYLASTIRAVPNEIAYFNELVGGSEGGYRYLTDSNVDWGQTPPEVISSFMQTHPGIHTSVPDTPFRPAPGKYLVSASHLQGAGISNPFAYEWFRHWEPSANINGALLVYDVPPFDLSWVAQCETPIPPLDAQTIAQGTGRSGLRIVGFDCTHSWIYPSGGDHPGIYALSYQLLQAPRLQIPSFLLGLPVPKDPFVGRHLATARLSFEKPLADSLPPFVLYEAVSPPSLSSFPDAIYAAPADTPPRMLRDVDLLKNSPVLGDRAAFLGFDLDQLDNGWEIRTWWQIRQAPIDRPFSIMAHLITAEGQAILVADGLGVSPLALRAGDIVVQRHRFQVESECVGCWLRIGVYWLDSMERWDVEGANGDALFIRLP